MCFQCSLAEFLPVAEMAEEESGGVRRVERSGKEAVDDFLLVGRDAVDGLLLTVCGENGGRKYGQ